MGKFQRHRVDMFAEADKTAALTPSIFNLSPGIREGRTKPRFNQYLIAECLDRFLNPTLGNIGPDAQNIGIVENLNGMLVLVPCALFLSLKANVGELDATLYAVQALELAAGGGSQHNSYGHEHPQSPADDRATEQAMPGRVSETAQFLPQRHLPSTDISFKALIFPRPSAHI